MPHLNVAATCTMICPFPCSPFRPSGHDASERCGWRLDISRWLVACLSQTPWKVWSELTAEQANKDGILVAGIFGQYSSVINGKFTAFFLIHSKLK